MPKSIIAEGKTTSEAIANGLKMLNTSKEKVNIKVLENHDKRSFFSILAPRIVKVEMTLKENEELESTRYKEKEIKVNKDELNLGKQKVDEFLSEFSKNFKDLTYKTELDLDNGFIRIIIDGEDSKALIGYRGEVLNSLQVILNSIANKDSKEKVRLTLNIGNYREKKREIFRRISR